MAKRNQQTTGWLDNFNDSQVSFPQGFVGDGTINGPKFNNGAINGQFQDGGTIYVNDKKDPRYKAYQDSLTLYNFQEKLGGKSSEWLKKVKKDKKGMVSEKDWEDYSNRWKTLSKKELNKQWESFNNLTKLNKKEPGKKYPFKQQLDILPNGFDTYVSDFTKPNQPVIVENRQKLSALENNVSTAGLISNTEIHPNLNIQRPIDVPKSWDVHTSGGGRFGGWERDETVSDLNNISGEEGDNRTFTPNYHDGGTIPGSVGFSYARTGTTPSNGKYAKKTMPSAQNGATVQYGTPEYREAYNRGEILSDTGERSPILLDEVTLQNNYKRPRNWLEQYRDKIVEENRDSGFLGAALGTPISAITSIPQLFAMKALTGKMQRPSEGLDIQNPYGAMATDAVLDPANLIGAGVLTKENTISNALSGGKDALMSGVSRLKPKSINPVLDEIIFNQNVLDYNDLPELMEAYRDKAFKQYGRQLTDKELGLYSKLEDIKNNTNRLRPLYDDEDIYLTQDKTTLKSDLIKRNVKEIMDPFIKTHEIASDYSPREIALADAYQWGYDSNFNKRPNVTTDDALFDPLIGEFEELIKKNKTKRPEKFFRNQDDYYVNNAWDKDGNVLQNKRYSELNVGDEYEPNSFVSTTLSPKNYISGDHLLEIDIPESQSFLNMASTGNRKFYQEAENVLPKNLRFRIEEAQDYVNPDEFAFDHTTKRFRESIVNPYRDGGIIEDNRGQWAHPGEITKINSGDITMKGVNYPVLGIDNFGNRKMMQPNGEYQFPGNSVTEYPMAQNGLSVNPLNNMPKKKAGLSKQEIAKHEERVKTQGTVVQSEADKKKGDDAWDKMIANQRQAQIDKGDKAVLNQGTAAFNKNAWTRQNLSDSMEGLGSKGRFNLEPNFFDDYINPAAMIGSMAENLGKAPLEAQQSDSVIPYVTGIGTPLVVGALGGIGAKSTGQFVNNIVNPLAGTGELVNNLGNKYLPNAYKLNPYAFTANSNSYYRGIGKTGLDDALENNVFRQAGFDSNVPKHKEVWYADGKRGFERAKDFSKDYIAEIPKTSFPEASLDKFRGSPEMQTRGTQKHIPIEEGRILKKDWLKGYKEIDVPKTDFKSEINWAKWNKEIPENTQLMKEYNTIEQQAKANNTWMKNPDGSAFQGTPEQFVQQNSENFKNAFPDGFNKTYRGAINNNTFRGSLASSDNPNLGSVFAGNKNSVLHYGSNERFITPEDIVTNQGSPGLMELAYKPSNNKVDFSAKMSNWDNISRDILPEPHNKMEPITQLAKENPSIVTTDDISRHLQDSDLDYASIKNIMDGTFFGEEVIFNHKPDNYLKSLRYNNGMFDMTNPNIYKAVVPGAIGIGALSQMPNKRNGGQLVELNQLTNFTNYNIPQPGGWLDKF